MKNIHLIPTDKPSRLFKVSGELKLTRNFDFYNGSEYQNIYITNDEEIKEGDWFYDLDTNYIKIKQSWENSHLNFNSKKIIAHLPLNNLPILEGVPLLPPLEDDEVEKLAIEEVGIDGQIYNISDNESFIKGYNKAKEKYQFTLEDLRKGIRMGIQKHPYAFDGKEPKYKYSEDEIIQSLRQPKYPVGFESEDEVYLYSINGDIMKPKTTTNSYGQTVLVGTYKYE